MAPWARWLLVGAMLGWTALTAGAGWMALRSSATADANVAGAVVSARDEGPESASASAEGSATPARGEPTLPGVAATGAAYPVPVYAIGAGIERRPRSIDAEGPRELPATVRVSKGVVVLDPGHGRGDPGATHYLPDGSGRWDITEAESNRHNAELIRDALVALGYDVYLTREGAGRGPDGPLPLQFITSDLYARIGLARAVDADVYLAIHGNGASVKSISGPETWYCGKHRTGAANERLATLAQQAMMEALHEYGYFPPDRGIKEDAESHHSGDFCQFVVTRESPVPSALIEFLFLSNDDDARVLVDDRSHQLLARHMAAAIDLFMREHGAQP